MFLRSRRMLGLMLDEKAIRAAEVRASAHGAELTAAAEFVYPQGLSPDDPARLGEALRVFLRRNGFSARAAAVGFPAKWLILKERLLPPANGEALMSMARLEAERSFATSADRLATDALVAPASAEGVRVLLGAAPRERIAQVRALMQAAGLKTVAIAPTTLQLASMLKSRAPSGWFLSLLPDYAELAAFSERRPVALRHIPLAPGANAASRSRDLALALAQASASIPTASREEAAPFAAWEAAAKPRTAEALSRELSLEVDALAGLKDLPLELSRSVANGGEDRFAGAAALALAAATRREFALDFAASRLEPRKHPMRFRPLAWAGALALTFAVAGTVFALDRRSRQRQLADLRQRLNEMEPEIAAAESVVEEVRLARDWTDRKPSFLEPLRALTEAFPLEERIWATNMAVRQDGKCVVSGKASDGRSVLSLLDRLQKAPSFDAVKSLYMRDAGAASDEVSFSITFNFVGKE